MHPFPKLSEGDFVEIIAPASKCSEEQLKTLMAMLSSWGLKPLVDEAVFGLDLLCANTDEKRFKALKKALERRETKAIVCARGGYGSLRLIPSLMTLQRPKQFKCFVGMSDVTALHLFFQRHWQWPTIHASASPWQVSTQSLLALKSLLFGESSACEWKATPLNALAKVSLKLKAPLSGGNLSIIQTSIGTSWQLMSRGQIIVLEDIGERGYRVDRMLEHARQASLFQGAKAIIFGDFLKGKEPEGPSLIQNVLERFAATCESPVLQIQAMGHGVANQPLILGLEATLQLGENATLMCPDS